MNAERAQMLREIRREYCKICSFGYENLEACLKDDDGYCGDFADYLEDLFAEAESQTEGGG